MTLQLIITNTRFGFREQEWVLWKARTIFYKIEWLVNQFDEVLRKRLNVEIVPFYHYERLKLE